MNLPSHEAFGRLRLGHYVDGPLDPRLNWEFKERLWNGEGFGFTEFLCPEALPSVVRSISLDLVDFPAAGQRRLLADLGLDLKKGMSQAQVDALFGVPDEQWTRASGRVTSSYALGGPAPYQLSCTVKEKGGLIYLVMMTPLT